MAKIGISRQMSRNIMDQSLLTLQVGRHMGWDDYPDILLAATRGILLRQQVKFGGCSQTSRETTFSLCSSVQQRNG